MKIFSIVDRFDEKIKLFNIDSNIIEIWKYGQYICCIRENSSLGFNCGYVMMEFPIDHKYDFECHGGITFHGDMYISESFDEEFCLGFDYGHGGDYSLFEPHGRMYSLDEQILEVEQLAEQIKQLQKNLRAIGS